MNQFSHPEDGDTVFLRNVATFSYAVQKPTKDRQNLHTLVKSHQWQALSPASLAQLALPSWCLPTFTLSSQVILTTPTGIRRNTECN